MRIRLISSGMLRSKLRSPASTCATGRPIFTAVSAAASVELTSPTTTTMSGRTCSSDRLEPRHDLRDLRDRARRLHLQVDVGPRNLQVREERVRHLRVVVLAGVDQGGRDVRVLRQLGQDRRDLDEVRAARRRPRGSSRDASRDAMTPAPASTSRTGANRSPAAAGAASPRSLRVLTEWRNWRTRPTGSRGWPESISHGWR